MDLITILASSNYIIYNKEIAKKTGIFGAILIGELFSEYEYYRNEEKAEDGWFYSTIENIEKQAQLTRRQQESAIKKLKEIGLIDVKLSGVPAKRYIKINREFQFVQNEQTSLYKMSKLDCTNSTNLYINNNKKNNNKESIYTSNSIYSNSINKDTSIYSNSNNFTNNKRIRSKYIVECINNVPYKSIVDYMNSRYGTSYKHTTNKTKDLIKARFNEGFTEEDFKTVIDKMGVEWMNTEMQKYLRPETLFGTKFENYLNREVKQKNVFAGMKAKIEDLF